MKKQLYLHAPDLLEALSLWLKLVLLFFQELTPSQATHNNHPFCSQSISVCFQRVSGPGSIACHPSPGLSWNLGHFSEDFGMRKQDAVHRGIGLLLAVVERDRKGSGGDSFGEVI